MSSKGRKLPEVFEYSELSLQLRTWYKHLDSLDIFRNLHLMHSNRINHELYSEPTFPAPGLYLLRHTLSAFGIEQRNPFRVFIDCWKVIKRNKENTPHLKRPLAIELNQVNTCFTFQQVLYFANHWIGILLIHSTTCPKSGAWICPFSQDSETKSDDWCNNRFLKKWC